ncbi:Putative ribosomal RNA processing protein [Septoria linicola]|uniref:Ribosomal RNA-processing protein 8 n=1 Tax=Septoria linicola TaxID=215465 RepID=A0A9Q9ARG2_9PEZI|nr:Putative ribosomal RNA processing protein [Septoria linicola]
MFAVKGWNVDAAALKPQTEVIKGKKATAKEAAAAATASEENGEKQSRKRKREEAEEQKAKKVDAELGQQWEKHIEGKDVKKAKKVRNGDQPKKVDTAKKDAGRKDVTKTDAQSDETSATEAGAEKKKAKKRSRDRKKEKLQNGENGESAASQTNGAAVVLAKPPALPSGAKLTPMQAAMRQKLISARFRHLNETLYTEPSTKALDLFDQNPEMFEDYHSGFRQQVTTWPSNPVDNFIATIRSRGAVRLPSQKKAFQKDGKRKHTDVAERVKAESEGRVAALPRTQGTSIIADLGCGDARLAQTLTDSGDITKLNLRVLSYDLHSPSPLVTKADISKLPADDGSVDIAIFCLALMGTNWISFIEEAYRILHWKGELWIAEIKSRFGRVGKSKVVEHSVGGKRKQAALQKKKAKADAEQEEVNEQETLAVVVDGAENAPVNQETDVSSFVEVLRRRGFVLKSGDSSIDLGNKMFVKMEFVKGAAATKGKNKTEDDKKTEKPRFKKAKFLEDDAKEEEDVATDDEAKTLKPCLYKIR